MINLAPKINGEVYVNCKIEHFPGYNQFIITDAPIFKDPGWEGRKKEAGPSKPKSESNEPRSRSVNRAKKRVHDIAALNDFTYFVTWTLNGDLIEREQPRAVYRKLKTFLSNKVERNHLSYIVIPELHRDGKGIHMHGLITGDFSLIDSGKRTKDGKVIYNMPDWKYGFSTCIEITGDYEAAACYITKYVSKSFRKIFGNFYYAGGNVKRIPPTTYENVDYDDFDAKPYYVPELGVNFKYVKSRKARDDR